MKYLFILFLMINIGLATAKEDFRKRESYKIGKLDSWYDRNYDYSQFTGRVTDRDKGANIFKVGSEDKNVKFFRAGDLVSFTIASKRTDYCQGFVRNVEENYFVMYVKNLYSCWSGADDYFRRGTLLHFKSERLAERVKEASKYRIVLLKRKKDFFRQLNDINHFVWSYDQQKVLTASDYDLKIVELQKAKQKALEMLLSKKKDSVHLQKELARRLDELDVELRHYKVDKDDLMIDRWHLDHDLGLPVGRRPQKRRAKR